MNHKSMTELTSIVQDVQPIPQGFTFRGKEYKIDASLKTDPERYPALYNLLVPVLYSECYAKKIHFQKQPGDAAGIMALANGAGDAATFLQTLIASNKSTGLSDSGWTVTSLDDPNYIQITKFGSVRNIRRSEYIPHTAGIQPQLNEVISFKTLTGEPQTAFYYVYGNELFEFMPTIIRFYWNVSAMGAPEVVSGVTTHLNKHRIPFLFKCLIDPTYFTRRDCCVLYLQARYLEQVLSLLPQINASAKQYMHNDVSLFSYELMPGLGLAESPHDGNSFGMVRMQMVATGILNAFYLNKTDTAGRIEQVNNIFTMNGVDIDAPFLNEKTHTRTLDICTKNALVNG